MYIITVEATSLSDAWYQTLYSMIEKGRIFKIDQGSYAGQQRLEFDFAIINIKQPWIMPLVPMMPEGSPYPPPVTEDYLNDYLPYLMSGKLKPGESYTYGQRICACTIPNSINQYKPEICVDDKNVWGNNQIIDGRTLNQLELLIWTYKNKGHRNNQMILQIGQPSDMLLKDPACCRHIDTRIQDGKLHFFPYFRSWDLFGGFPANLAAMELMKQYCATEIGVENGEIVASSKGLHLYDHIWPLAEGLRKKEIVAKNEIS
jgi:thymidylate synthase